MKQWWAQYFVLERITLEGARLLVRNVHRNIIGSLITATVVMFMLSGLSKQGTVYLWYAAMLLLLAGRYYHLSCCKKWLVEKGGAQKVGRSFILPSFMTGVVWGALGLLTISADTPVVTYLVLLVYAGVVTISSLTSASYIHIHLAIILPTVIPTIVKLVSFQEIQYLWVIVLLVIFYVLTIFTSRNIRVSLQQMHLLFEENQRLLETLQVQNTKTEAALDVAEKANNAKLRFIASASHDLRQPLQSISLFTNTLAARTESDSQKKLVSQISKSVQSLQSLFESLLDITSLDSGAVSQHKKAFYLKPFLEELSIDFKQLANSKNLNFELEACDDVVNTDPDLLARIIRNLVDNAVRYTEQGSIKIRSVRDENKITLFIMDTGIGIAQEQKDTVFDEFVQLNNPGRDQRKGFGLGLSIVKRLCNVLELDLDFVSVPSGGTTFQIGLPQGEHSAITPVQASESNTHQSLDGMFILILDDDEDVLLSMEGMFAMWGATVMVAVNCAEALEQLAEYEIHPDAIVADYFLQNKETGASAVTKIRKLCGLDIPGIILTGDTSRERVEEIGRLGFPVLHKPCKINQLNTELSNILSRKLEPVD